MLDNLLFQKKVSQEKIDEVYQKYHQTVNMSASELETWAGNPCSKGASLDRSPIQRNLRLLRTKKEDWGATQVRAANRTISFVSRMRGMEQGKPVKVDGKVCPSKRDISLKNWGYNPSGQNKSSKSSKEYVEDNYDMFEPSKAVGDMVVQMVEDAVKYANEPRIDTTPNRDQMIGFLEIYSKARLGTMYMAVYKQYVADMVEEMEAQYNMDIGYTAEMQNIVINTVNDLMQDEYSNLILSLLRLKAENIMYTYDQYDDINLSLYDDEVGHARRLLIHLMKDATERTRSAIHESALRLVDIE